jgi:hypothetical protein
MTSSRTLWLSAAGLAAAVLCLAAPARAAEIDKLTPNDAEAVIFVNVRQIIDSPVFKKNALDEVKKALTSNDQLQQALKATGLDPLKDVDNVLITVSGGANSKVFFVARGAFDTTKLQAAVNAHMKEHPEKLKSSKEGDLTIYEGTENNQSVFFTLSDKAVLGSNDRAYVANAADKKNVGAPSKELKAVMDKVTGKESMYMGAVVSAETKKQLANNPQMKDVADKLESATITLDMTTDVAAAVNIYTTDPKAAGSINMQLTQIKNLGKLMVQGNPDVAPAALELLDNLKITTDDKTVKVNLKVSQETIDKLNPSKKDK